MRICKVYDDDYPWDIRVEKIGRALSGAGHEVFLAARNRTRTAKVAEEVDTLAVRRLHPWTALPAGLDRALMFPAFFSPRWIAHIERTVRENSCEAILVRDLPLAEAAILAGSRCTVPVVVDFAENYPAALRAFQQPHGPTLADRFIRNPAIAEWLESRVARRADAMLVVCEEMKQKLVAKGAFPERVHLVGNTPDLSTFSDGEADPAFASQHEGHFVLLYWGEVSLYRGLGTVVEAVARLRDELPGLHFVIAGRGDGETALREMAARLGIADRVELTGFVQHNDLPGMIRRADLCVIPHWRNELIDTTLPNKLFDAMALGRATIASDALPLRRVLQETGAGKVFRSGDPDALARVLLDLRDAKLRQEMGENGRKAARDRYHWGHDTQILLEVFEKLGAG